jgi:sirohydrochlorin cobaltochelatase
VEWRDPIEAMAAAVGQAVGAGRTHIAYLERCAPTFAQAAAGAVQRGATALQVLPLFVSGGGHVTRELPELLDQARRLHSIPVDQLPPLGELPEVLAAVARAAERALSA